MSEDHTFSIDSLFIGETPISLHENPGIWNIFFNPLNPHQIRYYRWHPHFQVATAIRKELEKDRKTHYEIDLLLRRIYFGQQNEKI